MENTGSIKLKNPIMVAGSEVSELTYDFDKVTSDMFMEADVLAAAKATKMSQYTAVSPELDTSFHLQLGIQAVIAANPTWDVTDVSRIHGLDVYRVMKIGQGFMTAAVEEEDAKGSDAAAEKIAEEDMPEDLE